MKTILTFNLPEEEREFQWAQQGSDWYLVVCEIAEKLRGSLKHGHSYGTADEVLEDIRKFLYEEINDRGLQLL